MPPMMQVSQLVLVYIYIQYKLAISGRLRRWYCLNRFTLSTTSSPTFVGFVVVEMNSRFGND
jgi:hypothetical protein